MTKRNYYLAYNEYGSESSHGFANTWSVAVFQSKKDRDNAVKNSKNITSRAIKKSEITGILSGTMSVKPFSGDYYGIVKNLDDDNSNCIGYVSVVNDGHPFVIDRLF